MGYKFEESYEKLLEMVYSQNPDIVAMKVAANNCVLDILHFINNEEYLYGL